MGGAGMMSLSGAVVMAGTAGTLFRGSITHAHARYIMPLSPALTNTLYAIKRFNQMSAVLFLIYEGRKSNRI